MKQSPLVEDIELSERYDQEDDVYYVTVKTGEPSFVQECDDRFLVEIGFFTGLPTGFRILNYSKHKAHSATFKHSFKEICRKSGQGKIQEAQTRQKQIERRFEKFFDTVSQ